MRYVCNQGLWQSWPTCDVVLKPQGTDRHYNKKMKARSRLQEFYIKDLDAMHSIRRPSHMSWTEGFGEEDYSNHMTGP